MAVSYDDVGKMDLSDIYDLPEPTRYFSTLSQLDYRVPQEAKPAFQQIIAARREATGMDETKVIDIGCSYGVNAALLKYDLHIDDLVRHYDVSSALSRSELLQRDNVYFDGPADDGLELVGVDPARRAVQYAMEAGILDGAITTDLEDQPPTATEEKLIEGTDLVISTGCYGYITERTFSRILDHCETSRPWMANMVLRMFDFAEAEALLQERGYVTEKVEGLVPQRRFVSEDEQASVLDNLAVAGIDPAGLEATGWYFAELFVSRPREIAEALPIEQVLALPEPLVPAL